MTSAPAPRFAPRQYMPGRFGPVVMPAPDPAPAAPANAYPEPALAATAAFSLYVLVWFLELGQRSAALGAMRDEFLLGGALTVMAAISACGVRQKHIASATKNRMSGIIAGGVVTALFWHYCRTELRAKADHAKSG